jgi:hypothetical protein
MNCLIGALIIKARLKSKVEFKWRAPKSIFCDPWGHFYIICGNRKISWSSKNKNLSIFNQLWFHDGYLKSKRG